MLLFIAFNLQAQSVDSLLPRADSLFNQKRYTQSMDLYKQILSQDRYSESILLKLAFIEEGLGQISQSLYYLQLYYLASNDENALLKMEEMAEQHNLYGYKPGQARQIYFLLRANFNMIAKVLLGLSVFLFALLLYRKRKQKQPLATAISLLIVLSMLFLHVNFSQRINLGIVSQNATYLMSGPSAGSSVVGIVSEGHLLDLLDKKDVWVHVKWMNQDAYIKEDKILKIEL